MILKKKIGWTLTVKLVTLVFTYSPIHLFTYSPSNFAAAGPPARKHASHQHEKILLNHHHPDLDDTANPHPTKHPNLLIFPQTSIGGSRTARTPPQKEKARAGDGAGFGVTRRKTGIVVLLILTSICILPQENHIAIIATKIIIIA